MANNARILDVDHQGNVIVRHDAFPDLTIIVSPARAASCGSTEAVVDYVKQQFLRGALGPLPEGYSVVENPKPERVPAVDYADWCGLRID